MKIAFLPSFWFAIFAMPSGNIDMFIGQGRGRKQQVGA